MFAFLTAPVRLAVRYATREAAAAGMAEGLDDFRQDVAAALDGSPLPDTVRDRLRLAFAGGVVEAVADKPAGDAAPATGPKRKAK